MLCADNPGLIGLSWVRDDSINIVEDVTALHQHILDLLGALMHVANFSLRNCDPRGPHGSADNDVWLEGDSITVDNADTRVYKNAVFQSFPMCWTDCTQKIFMAILSRGARGTSVSTSNLAHWVDYPEEHVRRSAQELLRLKMIEGSGNDTWKSVYN